MQNGVLPMYTGCIQSKSQKKNPMSQQIWQHVPTYMRTTEKRNFGWAMDIPVLQKFMHSFLSKDITLSTTEWTSKSPKPFFFFFLLVSNRPVQQAKTSRTVLGITQHTPNKHKISDHESLATSQFRKRWSTNFP